MYLFSAALFTDQTNATDLKVFCLHHVVNFKRFLGLVALQFNQTDIINTYLEHV